MYTSISILAALLSILPSGDAQCSCLDPEWLFETPNITENVEIAERNVTIDTTLTNQESQQVVIDFRLPTALIPIHYDLVLQPYLTYPNFTTDGNVVIWCECKEVTNQIIVHFRQLSINSISLIMPNGTEVSNEIQAITSDALRDFLVIDLVDNLNVGEIYGIKIEFNGKLKKSPFKDFVVTYYNMDNITRFVAVTQLEPISARSVFPCFDEPHLKATFNVTIIRFPNMTALSNMPLLKSESRDDDDDDDEVWVHDYFQKSPKMSTYIVAFAVSDFDYVEEQIGNITVRIWVRRNVINGTDLAISYVEPMLKYMEEYLDIPYSLPKLDIIGIPNVNYGAMENWGLITFDEKNLLYYNSTPNEKQRHFVVTSFLAHEIAHQWFGNLVTMEWWNDIWLNEGFSTYFADEMYTELVQPHVDGFEFYYAFRFFEIAQLETEPYSHAVSLGSLSEEEIKTKIFTRITYVKGAILIRMMEVLGGKEVLKNALRNYLKSNLYQTVNRNDLWYYITKELKASHIENINVKEIMDSWVLQQGLPIVTITRNYLNNSAYVRQKVFQDKKSQVNFNKDTKWAIPLMFTTKSMNTFEVKPQKWIHHEDIVLLRSTDGIPSSDEWVLFNPSLHGYYIVNYDNRNWKLLLNQLITDHTKIPELNRMHLVQTLQLLKDNNLIPIHIAYSALEYIRNERNEHILNAGFHSVLNLLRIFKHTPHYHMFRKYLLYVISPIWKHVKLTSKPGLDTSYIQHITYRLACTAGVKECIDEVSSKIFSLISESNEEKQHRRRIVDESTLCAVMRDVSTEKWEELWKFRNNLSEILNYRNVVFKSFSCTENPYLLYRLLGNAVDMGNDELLQSDRYSILVNSIYNSFFSRQLALKIFKENLLEIVKWNNTESLIQGFFYTSITQQDIDELKSILSCIPQHHLLGNEEEYRKLLNSTQDDLENRSKTIAINYNWLKRATENLPLKSDDESKNVNR